MMIPEPHQIAIAKEGYSILKEHMIVYLATEERTGKSLASLLIAEMCNGVTNVGVVTKRKAFDGWIKTRDNYVTDLNITITTYGKAEKELKDCDIVILDEAHNYISAYPKVPAKCVMLKKKLVGVPLMYLSATPHGQGHQQLFHQFYISSWSPWKKYKNFYAWFNAYGIENKEYIHERQVETYTEFKTEKILADVEHLFVTYTRAELGFEHEPVDKVHYIELDDNTKAAYNELIKHKIIEVDRSNPRMLVCDSPIKLRSSLHMIEGGSLKIDDEYIDLYNTEKVDYIKEHWGDDPKVVIFYQYKADLIKLKKHFKHANILQGTANAEGVDLVEYDTIIVYSQDWSTAKHTQRRARQASKYRDKAITIHFLLVKGAVSEQCYEQVSINKKNFVDSVFKRSTI